MNDSHDLLGAYCTDALDDDERAAFEDHLATCGQCRYEAADFREVLAAVADAHPVHPPSSLEDGVLASARTRDVDAGEQATHSSSPEVQGPAPASRPSLTPGRSTWRRSAPWMAAAAAGALLFTGGFALGRHRVPTEAGPDASGQLAAVVAVASAPDAHVLPVDIMGTTSRVVMSGEMDKSAFLSSGLPTPAKGMVYQVWSVTEDGQMRSAGSFTPDPDGHVAVILDCGGAGVDALMITMEPPGGSEHPTGEMLAELDT